MFIVFSLDWCLLAFISTFSHEEGFFKIVSTQNTKNNPWTQRINFRELSTTYKIMKIGLMLILNVIKKIHSKCQKSISSIEKALLRILFCNDQTDSNFIQFTVIYCFIIMLEKVPSTTFGLSYDDNSVDSKWGRFVRTERFRSLFLILLAWRIVRRKHSFVFYPKYKVKWELMNKCRETCSIQGTTL